MPVRIPATAPILPLLLLLAACNPAAQPLAATAPKTASVTAKAETTAVATANADAADDPAIWRNPADPAASLIIGTDKKAGLYVYDLAGRVKDFNNAGRVNNVDVANYAGRVIVAASDRNDKEAARIALFSLDPGTAKLALIGSVPAGAGEAYGLCLYESDDILYAFVVLKDGTINQIALDLTGKTPSGTSVRTMKLATQSEGCVVDPRTHRLYVAEEDVGIWRFDARASGSIQPTKLADADGKQLVADAEGIAIAAEGPHNGGYLIASSQGDSAYAVYRLSDDAYVGRFKITQGTLGATSETDGIAVHPGDFGPAFPTGLMVAQDGDNTPSAQNFKMIDWATIKTALGL